MADTQRAGPIMSHLMWMWDAGGGRKREVVEPQYLWFSDPLWPVSLFS